MLLHKSKSSRMDGGFAFPMKFLTGKMSLF